MRSDVELVAETLGGSPAAYGELARRWAPRVLAVCQARVRRGDAAEDLAQEALTRGYAALGTLSDPGRFGAWLCGIATRTCLDWLKAKSRTQVVFSALGAGEGVEGLFPGKEAPPDESLARADDIRALLEEVDRLPGELRKTLLLFYYDEISYQEIADLLGVSAATVNARLTRARALLRRRLERTRRDDA